MKAARWIEGVCFLLILLAALLLRLNLATTFEYIHDEENTSIPLAKLISFEAGNRHLPIRAVNHPALPAYFVKAGSTLFGSTPLGYRSMHLLAGMITIILIYVLTRQWCGPVAACWAAALLAFNEYFLAISARATAHGPYLLFAAATLYAFSRFLRTQRAIYLYGAGASIALAFYCKEHSVLLLPVFVLMLLLAPYRHWWRSPHPYLAAAMFLLLIAPDIVWNLRADPAVARVTYGNRDAAQATYANHLRRIGGVALSVYPTMFYGRSAVRSVYVRVTGEELDDNTPEYQSMNPGIGLVLLGAVLWMTLRREGRDAIGVFLLLVFWIVFGFFSLIRKGDPPGLDPVSWIWVDVTMLAAVVLAGACVANTAGRWRVLAWASGAAVLIYAGASMAV